MSRTCFRCGSRAVHCPECGACPPVYEADGWCDDCGYVTAHLVEQLDHTHSEEWQ